MSTRGGASAETGPDSAESPGKVELDWLEKLATIVSGALLIAIFAVLAWDAMRPNQPAIVSAVAGPPEIRGESQYVPVTVENAGDEAVRDVRVSVESTVGAVGVEGAFVVEWLPGRSTREGVAVLPKSVVGQPLRTRVTGYSRP